MKKGYTEIVAILDKSGSMASVRNDALGGMNAFITDQKKLPGEATLTMVFFDSGIQKVYDGVPLNEVDEITEGQYIPRGNTALLDAMGNTIHSVRSRIFEMPESDRPENVIVSIMTDGEENSSTFYTKKVINDLISECQAQGWTFFFLGASQDTINDAVKSYGIPVSNTFLYTNDSAGTTRSYGVMNTYTCSVRNGTDTANDMKKNVDLTMQDGTIKWGS